MEAGRSAPLSLPKFLPHQLRLDQPEVLKKLNAGTLANVRRIKNLNSSSPPVPMDEWRRRYRRPPSPTSPLRPSSLLLLTPPMVGAFSALSLTRETVRGSGSRRASSSSAIRDVHGMDVDDDGSTTITVRGPSPSRPHQRPSLTSTRASHAPPMVTRSTATRDLAPAPRPPRAAPAPAVAASQRTAASLVAPPRSRAWVTQPSAAALAQWRSSPSPPAPRVAPRRSRDWVVPPSPNALAQWDSPPPRTGDTHDAIGTAMDVDPSSSQPSAPPSSHRSPSSSQALLPPVTPSRGNRKRRQSPGFSPPPRTPKRSRLQYGRTFVPPVVPSSPTRVPAPPAAPRLHAPTPALPAALLPNKRRQSITLDPPPTAKRARTATSGASLGIPHNVGIASLPLPPTEPVPKVSQPAASAPSAPSAPLHTRAPTAPAPLPAIETIVLRPAAAVAAPEPAPLAAFIVPTLRRTETIVAEPLAPELAPKSFKEKWNFFERKTQGPTQPQPAPASTQVSRRNSVGRFVPSGSSRHVLAGIVSAHGIQTAPAPVPIVAVVDLPPLPRSIPEVPTQSFTPARSSTATTLIAPYPSLPHAPVTTFKPAPPHPGSDAPSLSAVTPAVPLSAAPVPSLQATLTIPAAPLASIHALHPPSTLAPPPSQLPIIRTSTLRQPAATATTTTRSLIPSHSTVGRKNVPPGPTTLLALGAQPQTQRARPGEKVGSRLSVASMPVPPAAERRTGGGVDQGRVKRTSSQAAPEKVAKGQNITIKMISDWTTALRDLANVKGDVVIGEAKREFDNCFGQMEAHVDALRRHGFRSERLKDLGFALRSVGRKEPKAGSTMHGYTERARAIIGSARSQLR